MSWACARSCRGRGTSRPGPPREGVESFAQCRPADTEVDGELSFRGELRTLGVRTAAMRRRSSWATCWWRRVTRRYCCRSGPYLRTTPRPFLRAEHVRADEGEVVCVKARAPARTPAVTGQPWPHRPPTGQLRRGVDGGDRWARARVAAQTTERLYEVGRAMYLPLMGDRAARRRRPTRAGPCVRRPTANGRGRCPR